MRADGRTPFQRAVARAYNSPVGLGGGAYHGGAEEGEAESAYLGVLRRAVLDEVGLFDETIRRGEDWELNLRIRRAGYRVWFDPSLSVTYWPRESWTRLIRQFSATGRWRGELVRRYGRGNSLRFFAPPALVVTIALGIVVGVLQATGVLIGMVGGRGIRRLSAGDRVRASSSSWSRSARRRHRLARQAVDRRGAADDAPVVGLGLRRSACCAARTTPSTRRASATGTRRCPRPLRQAQGPRLDGRRSPDRGCATTTRSAAWPSSRALNFSRHTAVLRRRAPRDRRPRSRATSSSCVRTTGPGRVRDQVEVEAAQLAAVVLDVGHEEVHRLAGDREVEHDRRVVGDERVRREQQLRRVGKAR